MTELITNLFASDAFKWVATVAALMLLLRLNLSLGRGLGFRHWYSPPYVLLGVALLLSLFARMSYAAFVLSFVSGLPFSLLLMAPIMDPVAATFAPSFISALMFICAELNVLLFFVWLRVVES